VKFLKKTAVLSSVAIARRINVKERHGKGALRNMRVIIKRLHFLTAFT
jgi:hypothetical protein